MNIAGRLCLALACVPHVLSACALIDCGGRGLAGAGDAELLDAGALAPLTRAGVLEVDDSFSADERAGIELGAAQWNTMARGAALRVVVSPRARVLAGAAGALPPSDTFYVERAIEREGRSVCESRGVTLVAGAVATTVPLERGAVVCASSRVAAEQLGGRTLQTWAIVAAHETGHAMGFYAHDDAHAGDTVMTTSLPRAVPVTCRDVRSIAGGECAR